MNLKRGILVLERGSTEQGSSIHIQIYKGPTWFYKDKIKDV